MKRTRITGRKPYLGRSPLPRQIGGAHRVRRDELLERAALAEADLEVDRQRGVYLSQPAGAIAGTLATLRWYRSFIRSGSESAINPGRSGREAWRGETMTRAEAQRQLTDLIDVAINRKAGVPDVIGRRDESSHLISLRRDQRRLEDIRRIRLRVYQFETAEVRARFSHLLASFDDD